MLPEDPYAQDESMMLPKRSGMRDPRSKKMIKNALTKKSVTKLNSSRLMQIMSMNAARNRAIGGGSQNG